MTSSTTHLVLIPSYNTGSPRLLATVREALACWRPVWVVVDGSTDGSGAAAEALARHEPDLRVLVRPHNEGKGAAVLAGAEAALAAGFSHALVMDADGQHPADRIAGFMRVSAAEPDALVLGLPQFGPDAPRVRRQGRKLSVGLVHFETFGKKIGDPLFGFRVYPLLPLVRVMHGTRFARRYDFDPEVAVRLVWSGTPARNLPAACRYLRPAEGGISHFHYLRDNLRMIWLHARLLTELLLFRWPAVWRMRRPPTCGALAKTLALLLALAAVLPAAAAVPTGPGPAIEPGDNDAEWRGLFTALATKGAVFSTFTERRFFSYRKHPVKLRGEMRLLPGRGLSLRYTEPEERLMVIDERGMLLRDPKGRTREIPPDAQTPNALLPIMRFDEAELRRLFHLHAIRSGEDWRLDFLPRDPALVRTLGRIVVFGAGTVISQLEFRRSETQRVEVFIDSAVSDTTFTPEEVARFFR